MKLLVCGGRDYNDRDALFYALDQAHAKRPVTIVIHGCQRGADRLAGQWAKERGILCAEVEALWKIHGNSAGPRRNRGMLSLAPDGVVAFPGGTGTADMVKAAKDAGIDIWNPYG